MTRNLLVVLGAAAGLLAGCGGDGGGKTAPAPTAPKPAGGATETAAAPKPAGGGGAYDPATAPATLKVKTTLKGDAPRMRPIKFEADAVCGEAHKAAVLDEAVVAKDGRLANVIVYVAKGAEGRTYATPSGSVELDQKGCMYVPHVFTVMTNQPITIKNGDPTMHNIHALPKNNDDFNKSQPKGSGELTMKFPKEEVAVRVKCDVHGWMLSWAGVFSHPFHAVTGADGTAALRLPPGEYEIAAWQEYDKFARPAAQKVTLGKDETKEIEFVFEPK